MLYNNHDFLTGAGHFGFGFIAGALFLLILSIWGRKSFFVQVYGPFIPFVFGGIAVFPYIFYLHKTCELPLVTNLFILYEWIHCNTVIIGSLGNLHFVVVICGFIYCFIIMHYIALVKRVRRYGSWRKRGE